MIFRRGRTILGLTLGAAVLAVVPAPAEEFHLKDGTKLVGKIVAYEYEKDAFRVETSFGFAVIYKDRILRILFTESPPGKRATEESAKAAAEHPPTATVEKPPKIATEKSRPQPAKKETTPADKQAHRKTPPAAPPPTENIVEHVTGTQYVNETYRFRIFKPPTWRSYPQLVKPQTPLVAALGTSDETTLLLIGRETYNGSLVEYVRQSERNLQQLYENYRRLEDRPTTVAALPAIELSFIGSAEGRFWSGLAVYFARGHQHYTLLGLTTAGETLSFQQAVLRKVFRTLEFLPGEVSP